MAPPPGIQHREFLERALTAAGEWARFADPKVLGVLVLLGFGVNDLLDHAGRMLHPHEPATASCDLALIDAAGHSCSGLTTTTAFVAAALLAALTILCVTQGLFSRLRMRGLLPGDRPPSPTQKPITSDFFFAEVARYGSQAAYSAAVRAKTEQQLLDDLAAQVYEVSVTARDKHRAAQQAFVCVIAFLIAWAVARIALTTVS